MTLLQTRAVQAVTELLPLPQIIHSTERPVDPTTWRVLSYPSEQQLVAEEFLERRREQGFDTLSLHHPDKGKTPAFGYEFWLGAASAPTGLDLLAALDNARNQAMQRLQDHPEGYLLTVQSEGAYAWSYSAAGLFYALQTLDQLLSAQTPVLETTLYDWPDLTLRGVHIDAKGERPHVAGLQATMREWSRHKLNCILFEYEDTFPFASHPFLAAPDAYMADELRDLHDYAAAHHLTIVPLVQTIGHAEYMLRHEPFAHLREDGEITQFCSTSDDVFDFLRDLIREVAAAHPDSPWIHIGGDEAWYLATCPQCADRSLQVGRGRLYIEHINRVVALVRETGKQAILWDDVLRQLDDQSDLEQLDRDCIIHYWDYQTCGKPLEADWITYLQSLGFDVIGGAAMRGASGMDSAYPRFQDRFHNTCDWAATAKRTTLSGVITTSWGRYGSLKPLIEPFDLGWHGALAAADQFWQVGAIDRHSFDQRFATAFLGLDAESLIPYLSGLDTDRPFLGKRESGLPPLTAQSTDSIPVRFLHLLVLVSWWRSEEQSLTRKIHLLESRLYRLSEATFPEWERWRMFDRAAELQQQLAQVTDTLTTRLTDLTAPRWRDEYIASFTHRYDYRLRNLLRELPPSTPRDPSTLKKIGTDYG